MPDGLLDAARADLGLVYKALNGELAHREFVSGPFSIADIALFPHLASARAMQVEFSGQSHPNLARWFKQMRSLPICTADARRARDYVTHLSEKDVERKRIFWRGDRIEWILARGFHPWFFKEIDEGRALWPGPALPAPLEQGAQPSQCSNECRALQGLALGQTTPSEAIRTTIMRPHDDLFSRLNRSAFRRRFQLREKERAYLSNKGLTTVLDHARAFVDRRLAPANPANDGKQTPMAGHPVFIAQHATATCCRSCLEKGHSIGRGRPLHEHEAEHIIAVLERWLRAQMAAQS